MRQNCRIKCVFIRRLQQQSIITTTALRNNYPIDYVNALRKVADRVVADDSCHRLSHRENI